MATGGVLASDTGVGATLGVPIAITGVAEADQGMVQILTALLNADNANIPSATPASVIALALGGSVEGAELVSAAIDAGMSMPDIIKMLANLPEDAGFNLEKFLSLLDSANGWLQSTKRCDSN